MFYTFNFIIRVTIPTHIYFLMYFFLIPQCKEKKIQNPRIILPCTEIALVTWISDFYDETRRLLCLLQKLFIKNVYKKIKSDFSICEMHSNFP